MSSPPSLQGYDSPSRFEYPTLWMNVGSGLLAVVCLAGFFWLAGTLRGETVPLDFGFEALPVLAVTWAVTIVLHELVHGAVASALGYRVSYGVAWSLLAAYAGTLEQSVARRDGMLIAVAPVAVLTPVGTALLPFVESPLLLAVLFALAINASSATGDAYLLARLVRLPPGSIFYGVSEEEMYVYEPSGDGGAVDG